MKKSEEQGILFFQGDKVFNDKFVGNVYQAILSDKAYSEN